MVLTRCVTAGRQQDSDGSTIAVTFKVLLSSELMIPHTKLGIMFGEPLSDWQEVRVEMCEEVAAAPPAVNNNDDGQYRLMVGYLCFPRELVGKTIPYKYVSFQPDKVVKFEHIHTGVGSGTANRCLIVPQVEAGFTKYDDVILCEDGKDWIGRLRMGRQRATNWMLPRPSELVDPQIDFTAALETFEAVVKAHGPDGARVCSEDGRSSPYTFHKQITAPVNAYFRNLIRNLRKDVNNNSSSPDGGKLLRSAIYICLIRASKVCSPTFSPEDSLLIFETFRLACAEPRQPVSAWSVVPLREDIQRQVCDALKQLVTKFVHRPDPRWTPATVKKHGNWIAVIPFIHRWDVVGARDLNWLDLTDWKRQHRFR